MRINKITTIVLTIFITMTLLVSVTSAAKIKFDKKKIATVELIDAGPNLDPLMYEPEEPNSITILGEATASQDQMVRYIQKRNPNPLLNCSLREIVQYYYEEAGREGIRPDIALCQALKETGFFAYGGDVDPAQNNYCGLGATGNHEPGLTFETPRIGVRAHIQHLLAYTLPTLPKVALVDPRYMLVKNLHPEIFGKITHWTGLNGKWAVPGNHYGEEILDLWQQARVPDASNEALREASLNINNSTPTEEMFIYRGMIYFAREDYYNAKDDFESATLRNPNSVVACYNLAVTLHKLNKVEAAIKAYDRLLELDRSNIWALYNRGHLKLTKGSYNDAIADFRRVLAIEDRSPNAMNEIGIAHFRQKKYIEAYADFQVASEINDRNETVLANKAAIEACVKSKKRNK